MRKILILSLAICCLLCVGCQNKLDTIENAVDAIILEIDSEEETILVKGTDTNSILGDNCYINCSEATIFKIDNDKQVDLEFSDLEVGDNIIADVREIAESYPAQTSTNKIQLVES